MPCVYLLLLPLYLLQSKGLRSSSHAPKTHSLHWFEQLEVISPFSALSSSSLALALAYPHPSYSERAPFPSSSKLEGIRGMHLEHSSWDPTDCRNRCFPLLKGVEAMHFQDIILWGLALTPVSRTAASLLSRAFVVHAQFHLFLPWYPLVPDILSTTP